MLMTHATRINDIRQTPASANNAKAAHRIALGIESLLLLQWPLPQQPQQRFLLAVEGSPARMSPCTHGPVDSASVQVTQDRL